MCWLSRVVTLAHLPWVKHLAMKSFATSVCPLRSAICSMLLKNDSMIVDWFLRGTQAYYHNWTSMIWKIIVVMCCNLESQPSLFCWWKFSTLVGFCVAWGQANVWVWGILIKNFTPYFCEQLSLFFLAF